MIEVVVLLLKLLQIVYHLIFLVDTCFDKMISTLKPAILIETLSIEQNKSNAVLVSLLIHYFAYLTQIHAEYFVT